MSDPHTPTTTTSTGPARAAGPVLVVTSREDLTADAVILQLQDLGTPVVRIDTADFPTAASLAAVHDGAGWSGWLRAERHLRLDEVRSVYWRRPGPPVVPVELSEPEQRWIAREANAGLIGVLTSLDCLYVNHPDHIDAATGRPAALAAAARCGLNVPGTFIGNHLPDALAFADRVGGTLAVKQLAPGSVQEHGQHLSMHTRRVDAGQLDDTLTATAHHLQTWIDKDFEVRLTVVGDRLFAARIDAHSDAAREDFRTDYDNLTYQPIGVPDPVRVGVLRLLAYFRLAYAALDLIVDHDGRWWLTDLNPAGQYGWIEVKLPELHISTALAHLLTHPAAFPVSEGGGASDDHA